jgi:DNA-binding NarL/FixJ family response regulator
MSYDGLRVLVVDDASEMRQVIAKVIGYKASSWTIVGTAEDGEQAVGLARELQPDVILLDISMPVLDGYEALPLLRNAAPNAVVIMLSGFPSDAAAARARDAGAAGYLDKDHLVATLVPHIESVLAAKARA